MHHFSPTQCVSHWCKLSWVLAITVHILKSSNMSFNRCFSWDIFFSFPANRGLFTGAVNPSSKFCNTCKIKLLLKMRPKLWVLFACAHSLLKVLSAYEGSFYSGGIFLQSVVDSKANSYQCSLMKKNAVLPCSRRPFESLIVKGMRSNK